MASDPFDCPPELQRFMQYRPKQPGPTPANLEELEQLLYAIWGKRTGKTDIDQQVLNRFRELCELDEERVAEHEQRVLRLLDKKQPVLVGLDVDIESHPGQPGALCALVMNPTEATFREVRIRFNSPDLDLTEQAQPRPIRLLDSRDTLPVYLNYRAPERSTLTTLALEVDLCDHRGEWRAYNSRSSLLLNFPGPGGGNKVKVRDTSRTHSQLLRDKPSPAGTDWETDIQTSLARLRNEQPRAEVQRLPSLEQMLHIELEADLERTRQLQAEFAARRHAATRGTYLSRALLLTRDPAHAPQRIELVSRPFMIFGRYNARTAAGFGDFALGLVSHTRRISRLHLAVCSRAEGLAVLHTGAHAHSTTAINGNLLERGVWQPLESGDSLDICGLYTLRVTIAWDMTPGLTGTESIDHEETGRHLMALVDQIRQAEAADTGELRETVKSLYGELVRMQAKASRHNGVDSGGPLIYARFLREDAAQRRVLHIYLPKWLSIGSSATDGLRIDAKGVVPHHAELRFKDSMYWIQNHAGPGDVRVCSHSLAPNEAVPLEHGDTLGIGAARFGFERY